jgi:hypothetical protein
MSSDEKQKSVILIFCGHKVIIFLDSKTIEGYIQRPSFTRLELRRVFSLMRIIPACTAENVQLYTLSLPYTHLRHGQTQPSQASHYE